MFTRNNLLKYRAHHVLFWIVVFAAWYFLRADQYFTRSIAFKVTLVKVVDLAILVYITNEVLIPRFLYRRKYFLFALILIVMIVASSLLKMQLLGKIMGNAWQYDLSNHLKERIYDNVIPHIFLVIAGAAFKLILDYGQLQKRMADTAREKAETELNFLKSQINPHFLFNSINSIYFLIDKNNTAAREALHSFSEMLRFQLYEMGDKKIPVEKEIRYLRQYIDLQKLRKDENFKVKFHAADNVKGFSIEPLLLVPLVENAFKYLSHEPGMIPYVDMQMMRENGSLKVIIENSSEKDARSSHEVGGIGLKNVRRRLDLLYPREHHFEIVETDKFFRVNLSISI